MDFILFGAAELKSTNQNRTLLVAEGVFKNFDNNQSESGLLIRHFSKVLISANHNQAVFIKEILDALVSTNLNQAFLIKDLSKISISAKQSQA